MVSFDANNHHKPRQLVLQASNSFRGFYHNMVHGLMGIDVNVQKSSEEAYGSPLQFILLCIRGALNPACKVQGCEVFIDVRSIYSKVLSSTQIDDWRADT